MVAPENERKDKQFMTIRIDTQMKEKLQKLADDDCRTLSSQVTLMLKKSLANVQH